jgi:hypothetical protein
MEWNKFKAGLKLYFKIFSVLELREEKKNRNN